MKQTIAEQKVEGKKRRRFTLLLLCLPLGIAYYFFKFVLPGYSFLALVCLCLMGLLVFYTVMPLVALVYPAFAHTLTCIVSGLLILGIVIAGCTEAIIIQASFGNVDTPVDYIVVLGAKVNANGPSVSLWDRIHAAADYLEQNPDVIAVLSGGQGPDEHITEAQSMYQELCALGISPDRLWQEDRATDTWENIRYSLDLIQEKTGQTPERIGVLSSEYHLFRASLFARANDVEFVGIPAPTSRPSQKLNHFLREIAGVWHYLLLGNRYQH